LFGGQVGGRDTFIIITVSAFNPSHSHEV